MKFYRFYLQSLMLVEIRHSYPFLDMNEYLNDDSVKAEHIKQLKLLSQAHIGQQIYEEDDDETDEEENIKYQSSAKVDKDAGTSSSYKEPSRENIVNTLSQSIGEGSVHENSNESKLTLRNMIEKFTCCVALNDNDDEEEYDGSILENNTNSYEDYDRSRLTSFSSDFDDTLNDDEFLSNGTFDNGTYDESLLSGDTYDDDTRTYEDGDGTYATYDRTLMTRGTYDDTYDDDTRTYEDGDGTLMTRGTYDDTYDDGTFATYDNTLTTRGTYDDTYFEDATYDKTLMTRETYDDTYAGTINDDEESYDSRTHNETIYETHDHNDKIGVLDRTYEESQESIRKGPTKPHNTRNIIHANDSTGVTQHYHLIHKIHHDDDDDISAHSNNQYNGINHTFEKSTKEISEEYYHLNKKQDITESQDVYSNVLMFPHLSETSARLSQDEIKSMILEEVKREQHQNLLSAPSVTTAITTTTTNTLFSSTSTKKPIVKTPSKLGHKLRSTMSFMRRKSTKKSISQSEKVNQIKALLKPITTSDHTPGDPGQQLTDSDLVDEIRYSSQRIAQFLNDNGISIDEFSKILYE